MPDIQAMLDEIRSAIEAFKLEVEGLRDLSRLNLTDSAMAEVNSALDQFNNRLNALSAASTALHNLIQLGYPAPITREVSPFVYKDLKEQETTISAALKRYSVSTEAVGGTITIS